MAGALALAIGYSVVVSWIFKYTFGALTGSALSYGSDIGEIGGYASAFESTATTFGNNDWLIFGLIVTFLIMILGVAGGIEKANKIMIPLFFLMFIGILPPRWISARLCQRLQSGHPPLTPKSSKIP